MKKFLLLVALLAAVGVAMFFVLNNPIGRLVKMAVEEFGPKMTQTEVRVDNVKISASDGQGEISGFLLGNPKGFKTEYAMKAGKIEIGIVPASIAQDVVVIQKVMLNAPQIIYEKGEHETNFDAIQHNVEHYLGVDSNKKDDKAAGKKMIIESFIIRNAKVNYNGTLGLTLPDIELHNIGKNAGGATSAQVTKAIIGELVKQMALAIPKAAVDGVKSVVHGLFNK